jgi:hypothetical protein
MENNMAAIDKIYGTTEQYDEFYNWTADNAPQYVKYFYERDGYSNDNDRPITNLPEVADKWLLDHCPLTWVVDRIKVQYGIE